MIFVPRVRRPYVPYSFDVAMELEPELPPVEDFEIEIPTVFIFTEAFTGSALELYELPSGMILEMLAMPGPAQIKMMTKMFKLALIDPKDVELMDSLSFNELSEVLYQWYTQSPIRVGGHAMPTVSLEDIIGPPEGDIEND